MNYVLLKVCVISTGADGGMERSVLNRFLDYALWPTLGMTVGTELHLGRAEGMNFSEC